MVDGSDSVNGNADDAAAAASVTSVTSWQDVQLLQASQSGANEERPSQRPRLSDQSDPWSDGRVTLGPLGY